MSLAEDYPNGTWLGDENNPEMRVRCAIIPSDMLHISTNCRTAEKMALTLLDYLFHREVQAVSNLSGQGKHGKKQLDPLTIYGIRCKCGPPLARPPRCLVVGWGPTRWRFGAASGPALRAGASPVVSAAGPAVGKTRGARPSQTLASPVLRPLWRPGRGTATADLCPPLTAAFPGLPCGTSRVLPASSLSDRAACLWADLPDRGQQVSWSWS